MKFVLILGIIVSILLILVVLIQNPKGGGIASNFSSGNQILGVRRTNAFVEKVTWILAGALLVLALISTMTSSSVSSGPAKSIMQQKIENNDFQNNPDNLPPVDQGGPVNQGEEIPIEPGSVPE